VNKIYLWHRTSCFYKSICTR